MERLVAITAWASPPQRPDVDWAQIEAEVGTRLPGDYKRMVETFGEGAFDGYLTLNQEPWTHLREDGLLIWASTEHENLYCWRTDDSPDPDGWSVAIRTFDDDLAPSTARPRSSSAASSSTRTIRSRWPTTSTPTGS